MNTFPCTMILPHRMAVGSTKADSCMTGRSPLGFLRIMNVWVPLAVHLADAHLYNGKPLYRQRLAEPSSTAPCRMHWLPVARRSMRRVVQEMLFQPCRFPLIFTDAAS